MRYFLRAMYLCIFVLASTRLAAEGKFRRGADPYPGRYIVRFEQNFRNNTAQKARELASAHGGRAVDHFERVFCGFIFEGNETAARQLSEHPLVAIVEEDGQGYLSQTDTNNTTVATVDSNWHLQRIGQRGPLAPLSGTERRTRPVTLRGYNTIAYVIDSGVWADHEEFRWDPNPIPGAFRCGSPMYHTRVERGINVSGDGLGDPVAWRDKGYTTGDCPVGLGDSITPNNTHGTGVASVLAGKEHGVAPLATIVPVKIARNGGGLYTSAFSRAIDWVLDHCGAPELGDPCTKRAVANLSFWFPKMECIRGTTWASQTYYSGKDTFVRPTVENGRHYKLRKAGLSGATEPNWSTQEEIEFPDGAAVWELATNNCRCCSRTGTGSAPRTRQS